MLEDEDEVNLPPFAPPPPPDGGWGWVVVFASFMIHVIADGIAYSFGLFFVEISHEFGGTKSAASFIGSILFGMTSGSGPIASIFVNRFGCRAVAISGSIVAAAGFGASYWATSIAYLYVSVGLVGGLGLGLMYLPAIVCVARYFEKRRAFAIGIAVCGSGFGNFLLALIMDPMIQKIGWRLSVAAAAFVILLCIIFGAMFRPVKCPLVVVVDIPGVISGDRELERVPRHLQENPLHPHSGDTIASSPRSIKSMGSPTVITCRVNSLKEFALRSSSSLGDLFASPHRGGESVGLSKDRSGERNFASPQSDDGSNPEAGPSIPSSLGPEDSRPLKRALVLALPERQDVKEDGNCCSRKCCSCTDNSIMDFSLLVNPAFVYFAISNLLTNIGYNIPYIYLPDLTKRRLSVTENDPSLGVVVSSIGIANIISRVVLGYFSDKHWVNRLILYSSSLIISGFATGAAAHGHSLAVLIVCAAIFGATGGVYVGLTSVILVDLLGLEKLSNAFGIVLLCQGIGSVLGPPIVGALFDHFKSYVPGFWLAGASIILSGAMLFIIPCMKSKHQGGNS